MFWSLYIECFLSKTYYTCFLCFVHDESTLILALILQSCKAKDAWSEKSNVVVYQWSVSFWHTLGVALLCLMSSYSSSLVLTRLNLCLDNLTSQTHAKSFWYWHLIHLSHFISFSLYVFCWCMYISWWFFTTRKTLYTHYTKYHDYAVHMGKKETLAFTSFFKSWTS